jgi:hypothetical protein
MGIICTALKQRDFQQRNLLKFSVLMLPWQEIEDPDWPLTVNK